MKGRKSSRRPHVVTQYAVASGDSPAESTSTTEIVSVANGPANQNDSSVPLTEAAVFKLHSRAAATRKVYLAFKGCTTVGTWWNTAAQSKTGTAAIVTPRYVSNLNSSPSSTSFSQSELQEIVAIWRNVASDYALWDIDITTEELTAAQMERSSLSDVAYGARVCIGGMPTWLKYDGPDPPLGMSAVAAFGEISTAGVASKRDIFVFAEGVDAKAVMEAASHEMGHLFGLTHDGLLTTSTPQPVLYEYYTGPELGYQILQTATTSKGTTLTVTTNLAPWAPIMGSAAAALFSVWNNGQYGSTEKTGTPNNQQDDITILSNTAAHGLPRLPDEAGDSETNAAALCTAIGTCSASAATAGYVRATANAVINSGTDQDYFSFTANAAGSITIRIDYTPPWGQEIFQDAGPYGTFSYSVPFPRSDLRLDLGFPAGSLFSDVVKPQSSIVDASQTFMATVPAAGTYKFFVAPTTQVDTNRTLDLPSNYGNVGDYTLTVEYPGTVPPPAPPPDCSNLTTCNPKSICSSGCSCSTPATGSPTCSCNAAQGLKRGMLAGKPACIWNLLQPTSGAVSPKWSLPTAIGFFSAPARGLVKLPWLSTGCPAAGKKVVASATLLSPAKDCPSNAAAAVPLELAGASEVVNSENCTAIPAVPSRRAAYRVMRVVLAGGVAPVAGRCYGLRVVTSDGRAYSGVVLVSARRLRNAALP
ncbi:hypothetical protein OEZ86_007449 [Tetradesmus obliquus]|nr:hypothetical protein OEZ86_007449 [Tetradesmus obliquus]